jgi:hypothetical protein
VTFIKKVRRLNDLEFQDRHPIIGFFSNDELTEFRINTMLPLLIAFFVGRAIADSSWMFLVLAIGTTVLMYRNYRRYKERLNAAIVERDRSADR